MRGRGWRAAYAALVLLAWPVSAAAQVRAGAEFRVNTYTTGYQYARVNAVAGSAAGRFVVAWESQAQDGSGYAAMACRFDANGARLGTEFIVNTYTTSYQYFGAVGMNAAGRFVVAWQSYTQDGSREGVFAQRYDPNGNRIGAEFGVNAFTTHTQSRSSVGLDAAGNFVIGWRSGSGPAPQDGDASGVYAQRYGAGGGALGGEFRVNTYTTEYQNRPDVARAADGTFVVAWQSYNQEGPASGYGVYVQRYDASGGPLGPEVRVNTYTTNDQAWPSVAVDGLGNFVVAWTEYAVRDGSGSSIRAQRFSPAGAPVGVEFQVNSFTTGFQYRPQVAAANEGAFVVTWADYARDGSGSGIFGRRFNAAGNTIGNDFTANTYTAGAQYSTSVATDTVGNFLVTWTSNGQDGNLAGVYAQRFGGLLPAALALDTVSNSTQNGNGVFEPGENVDVRPSWRNINGASQSFTGTFSNMTGPPGATYSIPNSGADYGSVPNNTVGTCTTNCYGVAVNNPNPRPVQHWDASVLETISPSAQGQQKRWTLHIGNSFADVPNGNAFYRFIERLLHFGITGGCGGANYCPLNPTTREQMSVFVLIAKEGAGYLPPACSPPNIFTDVPETSAFCRFIEELFNRGVVGGCGPGPTYCPSSPVTREQMAVFVLRTLDPLLNPPACVPPNLFNDVPETSVFCRWIEELANRGVVGGCGGGNYCPTGVVTREQMGVFISLTFGLLLYGP